MPDSVSLRWAVDAISDLEQTTDPEERRKRQNRARMFYNDEDLRPDGDVSQGKTAQYGRAGVSCLRVILAAHESGLDRNFIGQMSLFFNAPVTDLGKEAAPGLRITLPTNVELAVVRVLTGDAVSLVAERYRKPHGPFAWRFRFDPKPVSDLPAELAEAVALANEANRAGQGIVLTVVFPFSELVLPFLGKMN